MTRRKKILIAIHLDSFFTGLLNIARLINKSSDYESIIDFPQKYSNLDRDLKTCAIEKIVCLDITAEYSRSSAHDDHLSWRKRLRNGVRDIVPLRLRRQLHNILITNNLLYQLLKLYAHLWSIRRIIRKERISLIVLGGDIVHYDTAVYIRAAHIEGISTVVIAGWMINQDENAEAFMYDANIHLNSFANRLVATLFPRWVYEYRGNRLLRLPAVQALIREILGLAPPRPWTLHSGFADAITAESRAMYKACINEGLPERQVQLTGSIVHDIMASILPIADSLKEQLYRELSLPPGKKMLLVAIPPDEFYRVGGRPECDFKNFRELVRFWMESVTRIANWNVVVTLHPSLNYDEMLYIEKWGVRIARLHTAQLMPLCDLFVASSSTTIQWATACGKPVINYDVYRYRQHDYDSIKGMLKMEEQYEFILSLKQTTNDRTYFEKIATLQADCAQQWGVLDGQAGIRILELFDHLVRSNGSDRPSVSIEQASNK